MITKAIGIKDRLGRAFALIAVMTVVIAAMSFITAEEAKAAESTVWMGDTQLINDDAVHTWGDSSASIRGWTAGTYRLSTDSSKLYLTGVKFSTTSSGVNGIRASKPLEIVVSGTNSITCPGSGIQIFDYDSQVYYDLILSGDSTSQLTVNGAYDGITARNCRVRSGKVSVVSDTDKINMTAWGALSVSGGELSATHVYVKSLNMTSGTIRCNKLSITNDEQQISIINGGTVIAQEWAYFNWMLAVYDGSMSAGELTCANGLLQSGGTVLTTSGSIRIREGNYTGSGGHLESKTEIRISTGNMLIGGSTVRASSGKVDIAQDLKVTGGSLTVDRGGIYVGNDMNISQSGAVYTTVGRDYIDPQFQPVIAALRIGGKLVSDGGTIQAAAKNTESAAVAVNGETMINGGAVKATIGNDDSTLSAFYSEGKIWLQGGTLSADGGQNGTGIQGGNGIQINNGAVLNANGGGDLLAAHILGDFVLNKGTVTLKSENAFALSATSFKMKDGVMSMERQTAANIWNISSDVEIADDIWLAEPSDGYIVKPNESSRVMIFGADGRPATKAVLRKVDSIRVKTAPDDELYNGDSFDPDSLVITVKFSGGAEVPLSYQTHPTMFSFSPLPISPLESGTQQINVTCLTKTTSFDVTVKDIGKSTLSGLVSDQRHVLNWTEADGATIYELYGRKYGESSNSLLSRISGTSYTTQRREPGSRWEYYVVPVRESDSGTERSGTASNYVTLETLLDSPEIRLAGCTYDSISIRWMAIPGAASYAIYRSYGSDADEKIVYVNNTSYTDTGLVTGKEYQYYVKAVIPEMGMFSDKSNTLNVKPEFSGTTVLTVSNAEKYELSWTETVGATKYEIWRGTGENGSRELIKEVDPYITSFTDDTADIYSVYNYIVVPVRTSEEGDFKGEDSNVVVTEAKVKPIVPPDKEDATGAKFSLLQARSGKLTRGSVQIKWKSVPGAAKYVIYGNKCGIKNKYKKLNATAKTALTFKKVAGKKVRKGTYYKFIVYALDKSGKMISVSKTIHVATPGGKAGNDKSVKTAAKKNRVTLKKGKTFKLRAKAVPASKKHKVSRHRKVAYETSNKKIAKVSSKGVIKAVGKGKCYVYAYAQNGVFAKIRVTVK